MRPIFIMPHYIVTDELKVLASNAINSINETSNALILSVDDGSPINTGFLWELSDYVIRLEENSGFAVACNIGFKWALEHDFDYIGCVNNDIEVFPGWLEALLYPFDKFGDVGITGLISSKFRDIDGIPIEKYKIPKITDGGLLDGRMMSGGLWLSKRKILKEVGLFDERFKIGGEEDVDLFLRIYNAGYKMVLSGHSCFWHKEGATRWNEEIPGFKERNKQIEQRNYDRFRAKWNYDIRTEGLRFYEDVLEG